FFRWQTEFGPFEANRFDALCEFVRVHFDNSIDRDYREGFVYRLPELGLPSLSARGRPMRGTAARAISLRGSTSARMPKRSSLSRSERRVSPKRTNQVVATLLC